MTAALKPADLITRQRLQALGRRSDQRGLRQLAGHLLALLILGFLVNQTSESPWRLFFVFLYGIPLTFLFAPLHESIHNTAFASRRLNELVAAMCGFILLIPARYFRLFHFDHHRFTQVAGGDPELQADKPANRLSFWWQVSGLPLWWASARTLFRYSSGCVTEAFVREQDKALLVREARVHLGLYGLLLLGSLLVGSDALWWYWILPALLTQPLLRLYLLAEHCGCDYGDDMLSNSRTTQTNVFVRFLAWNMPYHTEHHFLPSIPFFRLPELHAHIKDHVKFRQPGYLGLIRDIYRALPPV